MMYGMQRTTVYLPEKLKAALERTAKARRTSEADLIREGVAYVTREHDAPDPIIPLFESEDPRLAEEVDEALRGFGEQ
jgi:Arc/MetJ-type ribon-helix-helix transcriptional regulator